MSLGNPPWNEYIKCVPPVIHPRKQPSPTSSRRDLLLQCGCDLTQLHKTGIFFFFCMCMIKQINL